MQLFLKNFKNTIAIANNMTYDANCTTNPKEGEGIFQMCSFCKEPQHCSTQLQKDGLSVDRPSCKEIALHKLFAAIQTNDEAEVRHLMSTKNIVNAKIDYKSFKKGGDHDTVDETSYDLLSGWTPLHECIRQNNPHLLQFLIDSDYSIEIKDGCGRTPLYYACSVSSPDTLRVLLRAGANPNPLGTNGWSALMIASQEHKFEHAKALCEHGANIMIGQDAFGRTALDISSLQSLGKMRVYKEGNETVKEAIANHSKVHKVISKHVSNNMPWLLGSNNCIYIC